MWSPWLFFMAIFIYNSFIFVPFIDRNLQPLQRLSRMTFLHRLFSSRITVFSYFIHDDRPEMSSDSKALEELFQLYYPPIQLNMFPTNIEIENFRDHTKRMLTGLLPAQPSSCTFEKILFEDKGRIIDLYTIHNGHFDDWQNMSQPFILYFHGGGFVSGDIQTYIGFECRLSQNLNMPVLHVEFGLAPERPLPQPIEDVIAVYNILLNVDPYIHTRMIGMGDSSGGMLWIYLLQSLVSRRISVPRAVVLHSPWTDLSFNSESIWHGGNVYPSLDLLLAWRGLAIGLGKTWLRMTVAERRKISPRTDRYHGFPPLYITMSTHEPFRDDILKMATQVEKAGGNVIVDVAKGMMHSYALFDSWSPEARCSQKTIRQWIKNLLKA